MRMSRLTGAALLAVLAGALLPGTATAAAHRTPVVLFPAFLVLVIEACVSDRKREKRKERARA